MSKDYEQIKSFYDNNLWNEDRMRNAVKKEKITEQEFEAITGKKF